MFALVRFAAFAAVFACTWNSLSGAPPAALGRALEHLRDQKSYSWEVINSDPGPVARQFETRRGTVTSVQQNTAPNLKGQIDRNGDMRFQRDWADGLRLDTIITADGAMVTNTPEGWLSDREILTAQAEERLRQSTPTPRLAWLRRADRPEIRRPDQELVPFLQSKVNFEVAGDSYVVRLRGRGEDTARPEGEDDSSAARAVITLNLKGGVIRDYEVSIEGTQRGTRSRIAIPVSEQRIVVISYLPVTRIDVPPAAREKLAAARPPARSPPR